MKKLFTMLLANVFLLCFMFCYAPALDSNAATSNNQSTTPTESQTTVVKNTASNVWNGATYDKKIASLSSRRKKLIIYMKKYSAFIRYYGKLCYKSTTPTVITYKQALKKVSSGKKIGLNCASVLNWALKEIRNGRWRHPWDL